jgi:hypothetical protein
VYKLYLKFPLFSDIIQNLNASLKFNKTSSHVIRFHENSFSDDLVVTYGQAETKIVANSSLHVSFHRLIWNATGAQLFTSKKSIVFSKEERRAERESN